MSNVFDICVAGMGVAGVFAVYRLAKEHKNIKVLGIDFGKQPMKRRQQLFGWLGCLPSGDGKIFLNDLNKVSNIVGARKTKSANKCVQDVFKRFSDCKVIKDLGPKASIKKRLNDAGYRILLNNYMQLYPHDIHALSKFMAESIEQNKNVTFSFDNEVRQIIKQKNMFIVQTELGEFKCKRLIVCVGRSGWRWARDLFVNFGIVENNDIAKFGIRVEMQSSNMKDFNKSNCSIFKGNHLEIGPLSWFGTVIPEDHSDMAISAFRGNENRWKSDKVSFNLIGNIPFPNAGFEQTDRIGRLMFVLANDRIIKERVSTILTGKSKISMITPEYDWLRGDIEELSKVMPELLTKAYFHVPTILPLAPEINIGNNLETEVDGMYVAGESASVTGILAAAVMGVIAANEAGK